MNHSDPRKEASLVKACSNPQQCLLKIVEEFSLHPKRMTNLEGEEYIPYVCALGPSPRAISLAVDQMLGREFGLG